MFKTPTDDGRLQLWQHKLEEWNCNGDGDQTQHNITLLYRHLFKISCGVFPDRE